MIDLTEYPGEFTSKGWQPPLSGLTFEQANQLVHHFDTEATFHEQYANTSLWNLADLLVYSEDHLGDKFSQITPDPTANRRSYLMLMRISRAFADHDRRWHPTVMSIWTHNEVYGLPDWMADEMLEDFATGVLTRNELREECQRLRDRLSGEADAVSVDTTDDAEGPQADAQTPETDDGPPCPLCLGVGHAPEPEREAYLAWLAERQRDPAGRLV